MDLLFSLFPFLQVHCQLICRDLCGTDCAHWRSNWSTHLERIARKCTQLALCSTLCRLLQLRHCFFLVDPQPLLNARPSLTLMASLLDWLGAGTLREYILAGHFADHRATIRLVSMSRFSPADHLDCIIASEQSITVPSCNSIVRESVSRSGPLQHFSLWPVSQFKAILFFSLVIYLVGEKRWCLHVSSPTQVPFPGSPPGTSFTFLSDINVYSRCPQWLIE